MALGWPAQMKGNELMTLVVACTEGPHQGGASGLPAAKACMEESMALESARAPAGVLSSLPGMWAHSTAGDSPLWV